MVNAAAEAYKRQQVMTATPEMLTLMLYNGALRFMTEGIEAIEKKIDDVNLNVIKLRAKNNKAKVKRQKVLGYWSIVRTLRLDQKMSFRDISTYFDKYHKLEVSYSTIYELWNELENKTINKKPPKSNGKLSLIKSFLN